MNRTRKIVALCLAAAMSALTPAAAFAASPQFAHDEATWARLRDNVMEYDELEMLVEEYNPDYLNNQAEYQGNKGVEDANAVRQKKLDNANDLRDQAESMRDRASSMEAMFSSIEDLTGMLPVMNDTTLKGMGVTSSGLSAVGSGYASMLAAAAMLEQSALSTEQSAAASYEDSESRSLSLQNKQLGLKAQTKALFASYNLTKKSVDSLNANLAVAQKSCETVQHQQALGMATSTDVLKAQNSLQSLQSSITSTQATAEQLRQKLCLATGWKYNDQPEIQDIPAADPAKVDVLNPSEDIPKAMDANLSLKYNQRMFANMSEGSVDYKNMKRTIENQKENIKTKVSTLYNTAVQNRTARKVAEAALSEKQQALNSAQTRFALGMASSSELLSAQSQLFAAQIDLATADANLQQALENYDFAMRGYVAQN
ncbi:Outer membrane efflux protein [[Clostridium] aminophilum]|uniref:Outer membrane efflux protein n=1 Tax=[Clostridium] aminophilum TaxID=1526 RepID=A0A1I0CXF0_9FIRM|nr:TolC family protein [[Clostridium] aminophilum]SET24113.1 Outer membrane efflux protein [[Clostridium] aminophilum]